NEKAETPLNAEFVAEYRKRHHSPPTEDAADAFATAQILEAAVKAVGEIDQDKIAEWLHNHEVQTILGRYGWDDTGAAHAQFMLAQWQGGKVEVVAPGTVATTETVVHPKPAWPR
ncbi:MAG: ABC transporter substrate-binding protein, partial [Carbonactinosporaceae bacterium]